MSPTTTSSSEISALPSSRRCTQVVVLIIFSRFSAAAPLRASCTKRSRPEIMTMVMMMITVFGFASPGSAHTISVQAETAARQRRIAVKGLMKAPTNRLKSDCFFPRVMTLLPNRSREVLICASLRPSLAVLSFLSRVLASSIAASARRSPASL